MKTWKWLVVVLVVALLAVYYVLGMDFLKQRRNNTAFASQIAQTQAALSAISAIPADLEQRLADAQAGLTAAESAFTGDVNDTQIVDSILRLAQETGVKAIPLSTLPWAVENILGRDYAVFHLALSLTGDFNHLTDFIGRLENGRPDTLVVKYLKVDRASADAAAGLSADIEIAVYALVPAAE